MAKLRSHHRHTGVCLITRTLIKAERRSIYGQTPPTPPATHPPKPLFCPKSPLAVLRGWSKGHLVRSGHARGRQPSSGRGRTYRRAAMKAATADVIRGERQFVAASAHGRAAGAHPLPVLPLEYPCLADATRQLSGVPHLWCGRNIQMFLRYKPRLVHAPIDNVICTDTRTCCHIAVMPPPDKGTTVDFPRPARTLLSGAQLPSCALST